LMIEFVGISYIEVIKHAFLPAIISYIALVYIVHLEACKAGLEGLPRAVKRTLLQTSTAFVINILGIIILSGICYYGFGWIKDVAGDATFWVASAVIIVTYIFLVKFSTKFPELGSSAEIDELPVSGPVVKSGLYYILPVAVLIWCLTVERLSPGLSAFYATLILGTVTLTGIGLVMAEFVELISAGNIIIMLVFTAGISLILGMGLPTTANYIVVSSLMAPVIVTVGASNGLIVPLIAVHMFVFYFGILADDTPPVGLAAYAAAAISGGDPIKTGIQGFTYDIRTAVLPFMFIFNTELLMIGISGPIHLASVIISALVAMLLFAAATQGWFLTRSHRWETIALLLIAFTFIRPGFWMDMVYPPLQKVSATQIYEVVGKLPENTQVRVHVLGETLEGKAVDKVVMLPVGEPGEGKQRLATAAGLELREEDGKMIIDNIVFGSTAERQKLDFDWEVADVQVKSDRPDKKWFYIPAILLLIMVWKSQTRRRDNNLTPLTA